MPYRNIENFPFVADSVIQRKTGKSKYSNTRKTFSHRY